MDIFHQEKIGLNPLRAFFSPYTRKIHPRVRYATLYACLLLFWFFQSPTAETPAWILTPKTSNDAVLRKEVPFEGYKSEISYLTEFWGKFGKNTSEKTILLLCKRVRTPVVATFVEINVVHSRPLVETRSSAITDGTRDASCQLKSCQLPRNSAETTYTTSPDQIDGMKLEI